MSIINSKKRAFRPFLLALFIVRFHNVQNNWDTILIIIPYKSLICISCISFYYSILFGTVLGLVIIRDLCNWNFLFNSLYYILIAQIAFIFAFVLFGLIGSYYILFQSVVQLLSLQTLLQESHCLRCLSVLVCLRRVW